MASERPLLSSLGSDPALGRVRAAASLLPPLLSALDPAHTFTALARTSPWISTVPRTARDMDEDPGGPGSRLRDPLPQITIP